jgi:hypothetical protein
MIDVPQNMELTHDLKVCLDFPHHTSSGEARSSKS